MASTKRNSFLWSLSLTFTIIICMTIAYVCISSTVENPKFSPRTTKQNYLKSEKLTDENCIPTCGTKECVMQSKTLLTNMDSKVDPCDNADLFMCGGFAKKIVPEESQTLIDLTKQKLWIEVKDILDNIQAEPGSSSAKLKTMYDSCMDYSSSEFQGATPFLKFLENDLGIANWPYLNSDFKFADSHVFKLLGKVKFLKEFLPVNIRVPDKDDGSNYTHTVDVNIYALNRTKIKSEGIVHALEYFDLASEDIEIILSDIEDVEKSILDLFASLEHIYNNGTNPYTYVNCSDLSDDEWTLLCETVEAYQNETMKYSGEERKDAIIIEVDDQEIVKNLLLLMDSLPDKSLANYFAVRLLWNYLEKINFYFRLTKLKYDDGKYADKVQPVFWKNCIKWISQNMKLSLTKEFFRHILRTPITEQVSDYYNTFKSDVNEIIELQEWIPPKRNSDMIDQVGNLTLNIMTIKDILENSTLLGLIEDYYEVIHPTRESFFSNVLQHEKIIDIIQARLSHEARYPHFMIEDTDFEVGANTDFYSRINMQYGMFIPPFFTPNIRRDINLLSHAGVLGHEIGHSVVFRLEDSTTNDTEPIPEFLKVKECIENQFSGYKFDILKENLNGTQYYSENLADSLATTLIDKILDEYESAEQMQFLLPGLAYSTNQFLYMSAFQFFCSKDNLKTEKSYQEEDEHAPLKYRIIGMSQNSRSYSNLFQCPEGSRMNPAKKCSLLSNFSLIRENRL